MKALKVAGIVCAAGIALVAVLYAIMVLVAWWLILYFFHPQAAMWVLAGFIVLIGAFICLA